MIAAGAAVFVLAGCRAGDRGRRTDGGGADVAAAAPDTASVAGDSGPTGPGTRRLVFLGTSLTAGLGLDPGQAYPAVIQRKLDSLQLPWRAVNAGVSGETSAGALRRLDWVLRGRPSILVVETGANDMLRGENVDSTRANLEAIVRRARADDPGLVVVLAGMEAAPNLGPRYAAEFHAIFTGLAARERVPLIPFLLAGVGGVDSLNQADGIHPTAAGARIVAENVWRVVGPLVEGRGARRSRGAAGPGAAAPVKARARGMR